MKLQYALSGRNIAPAGQRAPHSPMAVMKRLLKEPLLHFVLLGAVLFLAYDLVPRGAKDAEAIMVSQAQIETIVAGFTRTWQRPPTPQELQGLITDHVREEVYYREALALGLDRDDTVVRRRLRQKMEFVSEDIVAQTPPTEAELSAYLQAHADAFRTADTFTFSHVYLDPARHGQHLARDAARLLDQLNQAGGTGDPADLGDSIMLERSFTNVAANDVASQFGAKFAAKLAELTPGPWQGPVESGYGVHLVLLSARTPGHVPDLAEARAAVVREWANARRLETNEKFFQEMLKHYRVTIDQSLPVETPKKLADVE